MRGSTSPNLSPDSSLISAARSNCNETRSASMAARYASARVTGGMPTDARSGGQICRARSHCSASTANAYPLRGRPGGGDPPFDLAGGLRRAFPVGGDLGRGRVLFGAEDLGESPVHLARLACDEPSAGRLGQERVLQLRGSETGGAHKATALEVVQLLDEAGRRQTGHGSQEVGSQRTVGHPQPAGDLPGCLGDSGEPPVEEVAQEPRKWLLVLEVRRQLLGEEGLATRAPMDVGSQTVIDDPRPGAELFSRLILGEGRQLELPHRR